MEVEETREVAMSQKKELNEHWSQNTRCNFSGSLKVKEKTV